MLEPNLGTAPSTEDSVIRVASLKYLPDSNKFRNVLISVTLVFLDIAAIIWFSCRPPSGARSTAFS